MKEEKAIAAEYYISADAVVLPNKPVTVSKRNGDGLLIGSYDGYWNPKTNCYTLYPRYSPHVTRVEPIVKHSVFAPSVKRS